MRCSDCGFENPDTHSYCGHCGRRLPARAGAASPARPQGPETAPVRTPVPAISGASFLGIGTEARPRSYAYLLEDDEQPSRLGVWTSLLLLAGLAAVTVAYWQPLRDFVVDAAGRYSIPVLLTPSTSPPSPPQAAQPASAPAAAASGSSSQPAMQGASKESAPLTKAEEPSPQQNLSPAGASPGSSESPAESPAAASESTKDEAARKTEESPSAEAMAASRPAPPQRGADDALMASGEDYLYGRGISKSCPRALTNFHAAAAHNDPRALSRLGALYWVGECVPQSRVIAYAWFARARSADPDNPYIEQSLDILWRDMTLAERRQVMQTGR